MVYIRQGIHFSVPSCATANSMDHQKVIIHLYIRRNFVITNIYLPLHHSNNHAKNRNNMSWLDHLPKEISLDWGNSMHITMSGMTTPLWTIGARRRVFKRTSQKYVVFQGHYLQST